MSRIDQLVSVVNAISAKNNVGTRERRREIPTSLCDVIKMLNADWSVAVASRYF